LGLCRFSAWHWCFSNAPGYHGAGKCTGVPGTDICRDDVSEHWTVSGVCWGRVRRHDVAIKCGNLLPKAVRDFRDEFEALLKETDIGKLVVVIDDLDRCLPETIIETLEAIKLFLFTPRTAFILGADERLVRYALRKRFPELPGQNTEVGRDYLEKLIQFPIHIPPLDAGELKTYINLLSSTPPG
jgi:hypothetical protein